MKYISSRFILSKQIKKKSCVIIDHELGLSSIRNCFETMILGIRTGREGFEKKK